MRQAQKMIITDEVSFFENGQKYDSQRLSRPLVLDSRYVTEFAFGKDGFPRLPASDFEVGCEANMAHVKVTDDVYDELRLEDEILAVNPYNGSCNGNGFRRDGRWQDGHRGFWDRK